MYVSVIPENETHRHTAHQRERKEEIPSLVGIREILSLYLYDTYITKHR